MCWVQSRCVIWIAIPTVEDGFLVSGVDVLPFDFVLLECLTLVLTCCHVVDAYQVLVEVGNDDRDVKASLQSWLLSMAMESDSKEFSEALKVGVGE